MATNGYDTTTALKQSVQKFPEPEGYGGNQLYYVPSQPDILPPWNLKLCDWYLRRYKVALHNTLVQGAITTFKQQVLSTPWEISGGKRNVARYQDLLMNAQFGEGWDSFLGRVLDDYLTQNFGGIIELIGPGDPDKPLSSSPTALAHLDAYQCWATGNIDYPVIYQSAWDGTAHKMEATRVARLVDSPSPDEHVRGLGICSLYRAISVSNIQILMGRYQNERLNDLPPAGLLKLSNVPKGYWQTIKKFYNADKTRDGASIWNNIIEIEGLNPDQDVQVEFLSFSQLPEQFNFRDYTEIHVNQLALAFGMDPQDIWPLTGAPLGTGTQSKILSSKARGKGYGYLLTRLERLINTAILPNDLEFKFKYRDEEQDKEQAEIAKFWMDIANSAGMFSDVEKRRLLADNVDAFADILLDPSGELVELPDDDPKASENDVSVEDFTPLDTSAPNAVPGTTDASAGSLTFGKSGDSLYRPRQLAYPGRIVRSLPEQPGVGLEFGRRDTFAYQKAIQATRLDFEADCAEAISAAQGGDVNRRRFGIVLRALIRRYGQQAYADGMADGGVEEDLTADDLNAVAAMLAEQSGYVTGLGEELFVEESEANPEAKAEMWFNKSIMPFYQAGLTAADSDGLYEWVYGDTEHCTDCLRLNGQKHRLSDWLDSGFMPQGELLECGGFRCKCVLERSRGRTRGSF